MAYEKNNEDINNEIVMLLDKTKTTYNKKLFQRQDIS